MKTSFYILFIGFCLVTFSMLNSFYNYDNYTFIDALDDLKRFSGNFSFWSTLIFMGFVAGIAIFFSEMIQYIGDEIVLSWPKDFGLYKNNCIRAFLKISKNIDRKKAMYKERFGVVPKFKAGYHIGEVTTGEIGTIRRNIIYTGDILNTAARLEAEFNAYDVRVFDFR